MQDEKKLKKGNEDASIQPDEETLHTTDPQDNMKGPVSSLMNEVKEDVEDLDKKEKRDK